MPDFRLVADHGEVASTFDAADDDDAARRARELSLDTATTKATAFRLERRADDGSWSTIAAWMPRRIHDRPVTRDTLIPPRD